MSKAKNAKSKNSTETKTSQQLGPQSVSIALEIVKAVNGGDNQNALELAKNLAAKHKAENE